jgi:hypothetical protein
VLKSLSPLVYPSLTDTVDWKPSDVDISQLVTFWLSDTAFGDPMDISGHKFTSDNASSVQGTQEFELELSHNMAVVSTSAALGSDPKSSVPTRSDREHSFTQIVFPLSSKVKRYYSSSINNILIYSSTRINKKKVTIGNNDTGRAGKLRCEACRKRRSKVSDQVG